MPVQVIMSGYDFLKSQVLSCWRKVESICDIVISSGRVFQTWGPATVNARSPTVERLTDGTNVVWNSPAACWWWLFQMCKFVRVSVVRSLVLIYLQGGTNIEDIYR